MVLKFGKFNGFLFLLPVFALVSEIFLFLKLDKPFDFVYIKGSYWLITAFYALLLLIRRKNKDLGLWVFVLSFLYAMYLIPYGVQMTDEALALNFAWFGDRHFDNYFYYSVQFGYLIFKFWLKILGYPSVLWARVGGAIFFALANFFAFLVVKKLLAEKLYFFITLLSFMLMPLLSTKYLSFFVPYDKMPFLFLYIALYFFLSRRNNSLIFSGLFVMLAVVSRFSFVVLLVLFPLFHYLIYRGKIDKLLLFVLGVFWGVIIFYLLGGNLKMFFVASLEALRNTPVVGYCILTDTSHNFGEVLSLYFSELKAVFWFFVLLFFIVFLVKSYKKIGEIETSGIVIVLIMLVFGAFLTDYNGNSWSAFILALMLVMTVESSLFLMKKGNWRLLLFMVLYIIIIGVGFFGTNVGLRKIFINTSLFLFYPLLVGILVEKQFWRTVSVFFAVAVLIFVFYSKSHYVYREHRQRYLDTEFKIRPLRGIYSTEAKVRQIEMFYNYLKNKELKGRYIQINKPLLFSFILDERPQALCWTVDYDAFVKNPPEYVIFANRSMRYAFWDIKDILAVPQDFERISKFKEFLQRNYKLVFHSDSVFLFFERR